MTKQPFIALLGVFLLWSGSVGSTPGRPCQLNVRLHGDTQFFWLWGQDSWYGIGEIECDLADAKPSPVQVRFHSWEPGRGITAESSVQMTISSLTLLDMAALYGSHRTVGASHLYYLPAHEHRITARMGDKNIEVQLSFDRNPQDAPAFQRFGQLIVEPFVRE